jgi:tRNA-Thr(GGU) m(6)t(6)A37 methyltransferase TsaA
MDASFTFRPIGIVHSPFKKKDDIPREKNVDPEGFNDVAGELEIFDPFESGLKDIEGFSHIIVLFVFHEARESKLLVVPPSSDQQRGVFATRSPHRPNPIGMTIVKILEKRGNFLKVTGIDMIEGTPILDIKPYSPRDQKMSIQVGWLKGR